MTDKGKEKFMIPSSEDDEAWQEGDALSDVDEDLIDDGKEDIDDIDDDDDLEVVEEDPFEPVYASGEQGVTIEPVSLDNILPEGSRRRQRQLA